MAVDRRCAGAAFFVRSDGGHGGRPGRRGLNEEYEGKEYRNRRTARSNPMMACRAVGFSGGQRSRGHRDSRGSTRPVSSYCRRKAAPFFGLSTSLSRCCLPWRSSWSVAGLNEFTERLRRPEVTVPLGIWSRRPGRGVATRPRRHGRWLWAAGRSAKQAQPK